MPTGPTPRLSPEQRTRLRQILEQGAEAAGFEGNVWTTKRIAAVIRREFGVRYHRAHVSRLVRALGVSLQKPVARAHQRNEAASARWRSERWPALKRGARRERRTIIWVDETAFDLLPSVVRTYAPRGQTPVLRSKFTRDYDSVIGQ